MLLFSSLSLRSCFLLPIATVLLLASPATHGQSLGEVARENREKKAADASTPPKVITNADLPKNPDGYAGPPASEGEEPTAPVNAEADRKAAQQRAAEQRAAEQWKKRILAQENTVAHLQARLAHLKASIHLVDPNASYDSYQGLAYTRYQARQLERLRQLEEQLDMQRKRLEDLQEAARHAGMHTAVYDP
jgi:hypothetical protein